MKLPGAQLTNIWKQNNETWVMLETYPRCYQKKIKPKLEKGKKSGYIKKFGVMSEVGEVLRFMVVM